MPTKLPYITVMLRQECNLVACREVATLSYYDEADHLVGHYCLKHAVDLLKANSPSVFSLGRNPDARE